MIQFYKKRSFGDLMNDTFAFFKQYGKNYFKNLLLLNGPSIIVFIAVIYIGYDVFLDPIINGNLNDDSAFFFEEYIAENSVLFFLVAFTLFVFFILMGILNYVFPVFYMKRLSEYGDVSIKMDDILTDFKQHWKKIIYFSLGSIFITAPLFLFIFGLTYLSIFLLIGVVLIFIIGPFLMNTFSFHLFDYFNTNNSFFSSLSYSLRAQFSYPDGRQKSPFWKYLGLTLVLYFLINTISTLVMMVPALFFWIGYLTTETFGTMDEGALILITITTCYILMLLVSILLTNLLYIAIGFMYYDNRTDLHRKETLSEIDTIGNAL